jgi:hypothetical protein
MRQRVLNAGFTRDQYSDWLNLWITPANAFNTMTGLENVLPAGKLSSTVRRLHMNRLDQQALMDVTANISLGGNFSPRLRGLVPINLVVAVAAVLAPPPVHIPPGQELPLPDQLTVVLVVLPTEQIS